ncbi:hypothetical protein HYW18_03745 [Candidatus Uhrbacteria bacterium]|nr:hypothetical protein [Candidatus Uhrbacteria bacterium]
MSDPALGASGATNKNKEDEPGALDKIFSASVPVWVFLMFVIMLGLMHFFWGVSRGRTDKIARRVAQIAVPLEHAAKASNKSTTEIADSLVEVGNSETLVRLRALDPKVVDHLVAEFTDQDEDGLPDYKDTCPMKPPRNFPQGFPPTYYPNDWNKDGCDDDERDVSGLLATIVTGRLGWREIVGHETRFVYQANGYTVFCVPLDANGRPYEPTTPGGLASDPPNVGTCLVRGPFYH